MVGKILIKKKRKKSGFLERSKIRGKRIGKLRGNIWYNICTVILTMNYLPFSYFYFRIQTDFFKFNIY